MSTSSGNALYLVCDPCQKAGQKDFGFKLAARDVVGRYKPYGPTQATKQLGHWLGKHEKCGGHPDHFVLAHLHERDHDQPKIKVVKDFVASRMN